MARPLKGGVDYFPLDCHFSDSVKLLQAEFGMTGLGVLIKLWQKIYGDKGYFCEWNKEVALLFAQEVGLGGNTVSEIIRACLRRGIFHQKMFDEYGILTSKGIQERYLAATNRRKEAGIFEGYALVECALTGENDDKATVNADNNRVIEGNNRQSKVKETKANYKSRESEPVRTAYGKLKNVMLTEREYKDLCEQVPNADAFIDNFSVKISARGYQYEDHYSALLLWRQYDLQREAAQRQGSSSFDAEEWFEAAVRKSYGEDYEKCSRTTFSEN